MTTATDAAPARRVLHVWGPRAGGPDGDAAAIDGFGAAPDAVITPSYWGGRRRELFAGELVRRGHDPRIGDLATEIMGLERPVAAHSFLVEVEPGRMCVSRLDFGTGLADSRLTFRGGDATEIIADIACDLLGDAHVFAEALASSDAEFIVADADGRLVADMRRRGWLAFPVPEDLLGAEETVPGPPAVPVAGVWGGGDRDGYRDERDERDYGDDCGERDEREERDYRDERGERDYLDDRDDRDERDDRDDRDGAAPAGLDVAALRRRARELGTRGSRGRRIRRRERGRRRRDGTAPGAPGRARSMVVTSVAAGVLACIVAGAAILLIVDGPAGGALREEAAARGDAPAAAAATPTGGDPGGAQGDGPGGEPGAAPAEGPGGQAGAAGPEIVELTGGGVRVEMPPGWRVDESAPADALVLVDGGTMRVLVTAGQVEPGLDVDGLLAGLTSHAAADPAMGRVRREMVDGLDVVVHEERPGDGTAVLWQHRVADGWQISVGCQFRTATIPQIRPICGQALRTAAVHRP